MKNRVHQVKSSRYYLFWGICTVAVVVGQLYVGLGYRMMANNVGVLTMLLVEKMNGGDSNSIMCKELKCVPLGKPSTEAL